MKIIKKISYFYDQWKKKRLLKPFYVKDHCQYRFAETPEEKAIIERDKQLKRKMQVETEELTERIAGKNSFRGIK
jgi:hypothetical protein